MKCRVVPRRVTLLIFSDTDDTRCLASCQLNINGTKGTIDTLMGGDFYKYLLEHGTSIFFKDLKLDEVSAMVSKSHIRLLKRYLGESLVITEVHPVSIEDVSTKFVWITMTQKNPLG